MRHDERQEVFPGDEAGVCFFQEMRQEDFQEMRPDERQEVCPGDEAGGFSRR